MGFGTVFTTLTFLLIFSGMIIVVVNVQQGFEDTQQAVATHQALLVAAQQQELTVTDTAYTPSGTRDWTITYQDEFAQGNFTNTTTQGDRVELDAATTGTYTSPVYDTGTTSTYTTISYSAILPGASTIAFQMRTADNESALQATTFTGPDGTAATSYTTNGEALGAHHDNTRLIQWRATITQGAPADDPELLDATIGVTRSTGHARIELENTGDRKLRFEETDVYVDGVRLHRSSTDRVLEYAATGNKRLWDPGERVNLTAFTPIATSKRFSITNNYAKDEVTVTA